MIRRYLVGKKFGRLIVEKFVGVDKHRRKNWLCVCECGNRTVVPTTILIQGQSKSCGCLVKQAAIENGHKNKTHGESIKETSEYRTWKGMLNRCRNPKCERYPRYGGRGIKVCVRWQKSYENFLLDMGRKPSNKYSIDRINNDGNYEPGNCRWATIDVQANNK